jgi:hypothetical protein
MSRSLDDFGFALWLTLDGRSEGRLSPIVQALAQRFAGPVFVPHMTLRGRIASEALGTALLTHMAMRCARLELSFTQLRTGEQPFETLSLLPEARSLERLRSWLTAAGSDPRTHVPHISLFYGHAHSIQVLEEAQRHVHLPLSVHLAWLELWRIRGEVSNWARLARLPLSAHASTLHRP